MVRYNDNGTMTIPKWLGGAIGTCLILCVTALIPWVFNISIQVSILANQNENIKNLYERMQEHLIDPDIHHSGIRLLNQRVGVLEDNIKKLPNG